MPENFNLNELLNDRNALMEADWDVLQSLKREHPYSHLIAQVLAKKHFLETGHFFSSYYNDALQLQNNPGQSFLSMHHWMDEKKAFNKLEKRKEEKIAELIKQEVELMTTSREEAIKIKKHKIDTTLGIKTGFTKWLLKKNEQIKGPGVNQVEESEETTADVLLKDEIVSESLAGIYIKQGLIEEAIEMYKKLSLINPKKSAYFAEIIENLKKR
jgi:tetratricopeptide (TPR) repeat protein